MYNINIDNNRETDDMRKIHFTLAGTKQKSRVVAKAIIDVTQNHDICLFFFYPGVRKDGLYTVIHCANAQNTLFLIM